MGTLNEDLTAIKAVEDTLTPNKVATFAYTEQAYQNNDANGVTIYDVDKSQNIPVATPAVLAVNETILAKGWRSQASSIPRMLLNHFLGRCSYNLNKIVDIVDSLLVTLTAHLGTANGIATLDASGKLPSGQIPTSVVQSVNSHSPTNGNVDISKSDVGLGSVANTGDSATPAQGGTEKFTTGGAYTMKSDLEQSISNTRSDLEQSISGVSSNLSSHVNNDSNPHNVTKAQVGLGNVVNTSDSNNPTEGGTQKFTTGGAYNLRSEIHSWVNNKGRYFSVSAIRLSVAHAPVVNNRLDLVVAEGSYSNGDIGICILDIYNDTSSPVNVYFYQKDGSSVYNVDLTYHNNYIGGNAIIGAGNHLSCIAGVLPSDWGSSNKEARCFGGFLTNEEHYDFSPFVDDYERGSDNDIGANG